MKILLAGGAGEIGRHLAEYFVEKGYQVAILDKPEAIAGLNSNYQVTLVPEDLTKPTISKASLEGCDIIVNLAWSFADDPRELFEKDIVGHLNLMTAAASVQARHYIYISTATVYGTPQRQPVTEDSSCLPELARKPLYAVAKYTAEKLALVVCRNFGLPVTVFRFWWAFGKTINGKNLRQLVRQALKNEPLRLAQGAGGTFLSMTDLAVAIELAAANQKASGATYNLGSLYLSWQEIGGAIIDLTSSKSPLVIETSAWDGPAFLGETWDINWEKAVKGIGYRPQQSNAAGRTAFRQALAAFVREVEKNSDR